MTEENSSSARLPGAMTDELRNELSQSKAALIDWLQQTVPAGQHEPSPIAPLERRDDLTLSFGQERLWFLYEMEPDSPAYNISSVTRVTGPVDHASLQESFRAIVTRHEVLRTTITAVGGRPFPVVAPTPALELPLVDVRHLDDRQREEAVRQLINAETRRPFDLSRGPVLRTALVRIQDAEHVLLITLHHAFCDGWSLGVLYRELAEFYEAGRSGRPTQVVSAAHPVRGSRVMATETPERTGVAVTGVLLEGPPPDGSRIAGASDRSAEACDSILRRHEAGFRPVEEPVRLAGGLEPPRGRDPLHDVDGRVSNAAVPLHRASRCRRGVSNRRQNTVRSSKSSSACS